MIPLPIRLQLIKATTILALIAGFICSPLLWAGKNRFFPIIKPIDNLPTLAFPFDIVAVLLFTGLAILWIFYNKRVIGLMAIGNLLIILTQDQMRWQPWVYLYLLIFLTYLFQSGKNENSGSTLSCLQWIIAGVYVWSGIHKLNSNFIDGTFSQIMTLSGMETEFLNWKKAGYLIPLIEIALGLALIIPRFRKAGIYAAITMHIIILCFLSPMVLNHNSVVYPWNIAMILIVLLLFGGVSNNTMHAIREIGLNLKIIPVLIVWILPVLNFWGYWDHYLSFSFYSNKPSTFYIAIAESEVQKIDKRLQHYFVKISGLEGGQIISVDKWALSELNVPFYPETRLFKKMSNYFCNLNISEDHLFFVELAYLHGKEQFKTFTCKELKPK